MSGRIRYRSSAGDEPHKKPASPVSEILWELMSVMGRIALGLVCLVLLVMLLRESAYLRARFKDVLPDAVVDFFTIDSKPPPGTEELGKARDDVLKKLEPLPADRSRTRAAATRFGMGSTKEEVLAAQGSPANKSDGSWTYGESVVYFANDRVIGWRNAPANPLRLR